MSSARRAPGGSSSRRSASGSPLVSVSRELARDAGALSFGGKVAYVYNPLEYARAPHEKYLETWGAGRKRVLLVGMNPGPFGMAQTGVPFGDVAKVRDFLGIREAVGRPDREHPKRPIRGFECARSEVSGTRLWGWAEERFGVASKFFESFFVHNYCPLAFLEENGKNLTPDKLPSSQRDTLFLACDRALRQIVEVLEPEFVIGVGAFATDRARAALSGYSGVVGTVLHPSPASPKANRGWARIVDTELAEIGVKLPAMRR